MRILYVEDQVALHAYVCELLASDDRHITACTTAEAALRMDNAQPFDVVIADVTLPGMSGLELSQYLLSQRPNRCIILCTGHMLTADALPRGPQVHCLTKPFDIDALDALLLAAHPISAR